MKIATEPEEDQPWTNGPDVIDVCPADQHDWVLDISEGSATLHCDADNCWNVNTRAKTDIQTLLGEDAAWLIEGRFHVDVTVKTAPARWITVDEYDPGFSWAEVKPKIDVV